MLRFFLATYLAVGVLGAPVHPDLSARQIPATGLAPVVDLGYSQYQGVYEGATNVNVYRG
jgi:hypothetical protein